MRNQVQKLVENQKVASMMAYPVRTSPTVIFYDELLGLTEKASEKKLGTAIELVVQRGEGFSTEPGFNPRP